MIIGVPKEIKNKENRVAVTPAGVSEFVKNGHIVYVQATAGIGSGFSEEDSRLLEAFSHPIATAMENGRLYAEAERQRRAIQMTAHVFSQPLLIMDEQGTILVANAAANHLLENHMA